MLALRGKKYNREVLPDSINETFDNIETLKTNKESLNAMEYLAKMQLYYININTYICTEVDNTLNMDLWGIKWKQKIIEKLLRF